MGLAALGQSNGDPDLNGRPAASVPASPDADGRSATLVPKAIPPPVLSPEIELAFSRVKTRINIVELTATSIAGSLNYSVFGFAAVEAVDASGFGEAFPVEPPFVFSFGVPSESNPAGGTLHWAGTLVGTDSGTGLHGTTILGDVDILITDLLNPRIEIVLQGLVDFDRNSSLDRMTWSDVAVENGAFAAGTQGNRVDGRFYGPEHEEVGGTFERDGIVGAFGAQRQQPFALTVSEPASTDVTEPTEFLALLSRTLLTGDLTFEPRGRSSSPRPASPTPFAQFEELQSMAGEAALGFGSTTVGLRGSVRRDGVQEGRIEWLSKVGLGGQGFEVELEIEISGRFNWLENGGAFVGESRVTFVEGIEGFPLPEINATYQVAAGRTAFLNPFPTDDQWSGDMVGKDVDASPNSGIPITGDAGLAMGDLYQLHLDIEFTNVLDADGKRPRSDFEWTGVPMSAGVFRSHQDGDLVQGLFLGPGANEAVGFFERDGVFGTFVAERGEPSSTDPDAPARSFDVLAYLDTLDLASISNASTAVAEDPSLFSDALASVTWTHSTRFGIELREGSALEIPVGQEVANIEVFGGWLEHGFFAVMGIQSRPLDVPDPPGISLAATLGAITGSNPPSGSARWEGAMLGIDVGGGETHGNRIRSRASIIFEDLYYANVDVVFTKVIDLSTNSRRSDMKWWGIPLSAGAFEASLDDHRVSGRFFGPQHEEVTGTFLWYDILGAFGAKRMQP